MQNTLRFVPSLGLAALAACSLIARPADAQAATYFPNNATINYMTAGEAFIGLNTSLVPSSPTVNLVPGGEIGSDCFIYGGSTFNDSGGLVDDHLFCYNTSTTNVSSGDVGSYVYAYNSSTVNISGGTFGNFKGVNFFDQTSGAFTFIGPGLSYALDPAGQTPVGGTDYILTGRLQNGDNVTGDVVEVTPGAAMFTLSTPAAVPETSTAVSTGLGVFCLAGLILKAYKQRAAKKGA